MIAIVAAVSAATVAGIVANSFAPVGGATRLSHFIEASASRRCARSDLLSGPRWEAALFAHPRKTPDGRDYLGVPAGAGVSFDEPPQTKAAVEPAGRKVRHYRNPMGLPDVSPVPKKDSMGMDYIPVYEDDDSDDGSVRLSPGKIQRTGVKSEPAARRIIRTTIRAPGTIQLDERRISVIAMRAESFVQKVADVTTGTHVVKGQPLMEIYSPAILSAAAEYIATINSKTTGGRGCTAEVRDSG